MSARPDSRDSALARTLRLAVAAARRFYADRCLLHASALTYTSLLSLVPLLAIMFAVLKGLGVQRRLEPLLLSRLALSPDVTERILTYIDRTNVGGLGAIGAGALIVTVLTVMGRIEESFNFIWRVRHPRSWVRKLTDYASTLLLTPFLLLIAVTLTSSIQEQALMRLLLRTEYIGDAVPFALKAAPLVINAVALGALYTIMPNRRPYWLGILVGAVAAGAGWQAVQSAYVSLQIGVARYNAIYGALSQLPVTLVWLYVSWAVVLAGAELAAVLEFGAEAADDDRPVSRWAIALHALARAVDCFRAKGGTIDARGLARELRVPTDAVADALDELEAGGFLALVADNGRGYVLARDPAGIDLGSLDVVVDGAPLPPGCDARVVRAVAELTRTRRTTLSTRTLADVVGGQ